MAALFTTMSMPPKFLIARSTRCLATPGEATLSLKAMAFLPSAARVARDGGIAVVAADRGAVVGHDHAGTLGHQRLGDGAADAAAGAGDDRLRVLREVPS